MLGIRLRKNLEFRRSVSHSLENTLNTYINMHSGQYLTYWIYDASLYNMVQAINTSMHPLVLKAIFINT